MAFVLPHLLNDVGALVRRKAREDFRSARWFQLFEDCGATAHCGLVEHFDGPLTPAAS